MLFFGVIGDPEGHEMASPFDLGVARLQQQASYAKPGGGYEFMRRVSDDLAVRPLPPKPEANGTQKAAFCIGRPLD